MQCNGIEGIEAVAFPMLPKLIEADGKPRFRKLHQGYLALKILTKKKRLGQRHEALF